MATDVHDPGRLPALIVVDVQRAFEDPSWGPRNNPQAEQRIAEAIAGWRERGAPVLHVRHASRAPDGLFVPGTPAFDFMAEAQPLDGEPVITKDVNSAFIGTDLEARLRDGGVDAVAVAGLTTDHCCSTTARMAANLGFETWVLGDAMATFDRRGPDGDLLAADLMHHTALASLHGEFADVIDTRDALARIARLRLSRDPARRS